MSQSNNTFNLLLVLSLAFLISTTESRNISAGFEMQDSTAVCNSVHGVDSGETCSAVAQEFSLSLQDFLSINPNINCDSVFVGQWVCVDGSSN